MTYPLFIIDIHLPIIDQFFIYASQVDVVH